MPTEIKKEIQLEIAHVLFIDIVGYSKLLIEEQHALLETLNQIVRGTEQFRNAEAAGKLIKIPTGDGIALVFQDRLEAPAECALEISLALKEHPTLPLRMGIHSGPVSGVVDVNERMNVAGAGINMAQRVMDCGDAGHILLSKHVAEDLEQFARWKPLLHDLGECEVKHGVRVHVVNLHTAELGNSESPEKFRHLRGKNKISAAISRSKETIARSSIALVVGVLIMVLVIWLVQAQRHQTGVIQKQGDQVDVLVNRYQKMQQALVRLADVEAQSKQPGAKLSPEEERANAYSILEKELGLPAGSLVKELPGFALELYSRTDTTSLMRARAAYALGKFDEAQKLSLEGAKQDAQAFETAQQVQQDRRKSAIEGYKLAGQSAQKLIQYKEAMAYLREAEKLTDRDREAKGWTEVQDAIADLFFDQGEYKNAEDILRSVVEIRAQRFGPANSTTLKSRNRLTYARWKQGKLAEAEADFRELIKVEERVLGPGHRDTLSSRNGLAGVLEEQGKHREAEAEHRLLLELREKALGPEDIDTLRSRFNVGIATANRGKYAEAEAQFREVIKLDEKVLGPEHPETLVGRASLAATLNAQGNFAAAEAEYRKVIKVEEKVLGPAHPDTLSSRRLFTDALLSQGKFAEVEAQCRDVIKLQEKVLGREHPETLRSRNNLANVLNKQRKYAEAEEQCRDVIQLQEKVLGPEAVDTLSSRELLANALTGQAKYAEADAQFRDVIKLEEKVMGPQDPYTLDACYDFASGLKGQGKLNEAMDFGRRAAEGARKVLGFDNPDTKRYEKLLADLEAKK